MTATSAPPIRTPRRSRTIARVAAVQGLFQCEQSGDTAETVIDQFERHRRVTPSASFEDGHIPDADLKLFAEVVRGVTFKQDTIDATLSDVLPEQWPISRLDPVLRALLRAATFEIGTETASRIIINEYMDVAHGFFFGDEPKMVNGILDTLARRHDAQV
ncbi:transcription antitermination factor NusB [Gluconobacter wancherniae]|uniref:Transcription antitermination protein NusB n=1 Tax=Gluconobacter wancherniae NBRC 103581 TaxID=656744 RepID=A0A511AYS8_9PROT|nr:transcription antitermination factor NusB [Gluconobacter wancherniae]MBF0853522.1 transcription antitermination factor NusB [Gluconobacter wancherniae]MBS1063240.1 transcription antitermination factor NusB [Gluconobacter wancherniae]MBS1088342.1 transcription antitermination factor NusB [Gluconobacter wancherniae]MBS1094027.1 transcription antitermination factor NusB [Gluconobacter wancherniae]GBD55735.1 N utilization substance protein B homolog [Gluconobacter wancherniae NBRC 103581]